LATTRPTVLCVVPHSSAAARCQRPLNTEHLGLPKVWLTAVVRVMLLVRGDSVR
jgi:hypothetical protein